MNIDSTNDRHEKWKKIIEDQEASGLSQEVFCKKHNLKTATLAYYRSAFRKKKSPNGTSGHFAKVNLAKPQATNEIRLALPNGFHCVFPVDIDPVRAKELIRIFLSC